MDFKIPHECEAVWRLFEEICSIPHPSGYEAKLGEWVLRQAQAHHLKAERDSFGNIRIDRPASKGYENAPLTILQAHLDMVPQAEEGEDFNFLLDPIRLQEENGWVRSAARTTLGSDDGIGVAAALALLFDEEFQCGPLAALFTVEEETGLTGANNVSAEYLRGDFLLNLDSEEEGIFYVGCAGGVRLEAVFDPGSEPVDADCGAEVVVRGLAGGHSGANIADRRGNAVQFLNRFLAAHPEFRVSAVSGGSLDNVIPREAAAVGICGDMQALQDAAKHFQKTLREEFNAPDSFVICIKACEAPLSVWKSSRQNEILQCLSTMPNGVIAFDSRFDVVRTSSNLAAWSMENGMLRVRTSQRSLANQERKQLTGDLIARLERAGGKCTENNPYSGWEPSPESVIAGLSREVYKDMFGKVPEIKVIHAGLECGILREKNDRADMISFGPTLTDPHSPAEKLEIASVPRFYSFLQALLLKIAKKNKDFQFRV